MTNTKHETNSPSTGCPVCREWQRDMDGTLATFNKVKQLNQQLAGSLVDVVRICEALRFTAGLGKNQMERIDRAKATLAEMKRSGT